MLFRNVIIVAALALAGCAMPLGKKVGALPPEGTQAEVFIYRPKDSAQNYFEALIDGHKTRSHLKNGSVILAQTTPGRHEFDLQSASLIKRKDVQTNKVMFDAQPGKRVYIRAMITGGSETTGFVSGMATVYGYYVFTSEVVSEETARSEAAELNYAD